MIHRPSINRQGYLKVPKERKTEPFLLEGEKLHVSESEEWPS